MLTFHHATVFLLIATQFFSLEPCAETRLSRAMPQLLHSVLSKCDGSCIHSASSQSLTRPPRAEAVACRACLRLASAARPWTHLPDDRTVTNSIATARAIPGQPVGGFSRGCCSHGLDCNIADSSRSSSVSGGRYGTIKHSAAPDSACMYGAGGRSCYRSAASSSTILSRDNQRPALLSGAPTSVATVATAAAIAAPMLLLLSVDVHVAHAFEAVEAAGTAVAAAATATAAGELTAAVTTAAAAADATPTAHGAYVPSPLEPGWEVWVGFVAGVAPFVIGAYEFGKRILIQRRCEVCGGRGLVASSGAGSDKYLRKCPQCGGFFPWISWKLFLTSTAAPGNGGPLQQPRGQTSILYSVPEPADATKQAEARARSQSAIDACQDPGRRPGSPTQVAAEILAEGKTEDADGSATVAASAEARAGHGGCDPGHSLDASAKEMSGQE
ncbi:hypothetical protein Agub_g2928 [Astrephomene gubernaculifera]|uniref:Uncharacterized protein n=1 Tax=Astrephomene gubernaculifera TaxID=47775 RepID=A0AAD3DHS7_9CHLO|nr:hypothetical protein Agub_g2928 [Astrephomene gubernaculifera]